MNRQGDEVSSVRTRVAFEIQKSESGVFFSAEGSRTAPHRSRFSVTSVGFFPCEFTVKSDIFLHTAMHCTLLLTVI